MGTLAALLAQLVFSFLMATCQESREGHLEEPFTFRIGESVRIEDEGVTVTFQEVASDSRCPVDVTCIHAGEAVVRLRLVNDSGESAVLELNVPPGGASAAGKFEDLLVTVLELKPQTDSRKRIQPSDYQATVELGRT